jgi:hypothetical protein
MWQHKFRLTVAILVFAALQLSACRPASSPPTNVAPSRVEPIEGSDLKRVILTAKAAERIGIETAQVLEGQAGRTREIGGQVVESPQAGSGAMLVRVSLSEGDLASIDRNQPVIVLPLDDDEDDDDEEDEGAEAEAVDDVEDDEDEGPAIYFSVKNTGQQTLAPGQPVRVLVSLTTSGASTSRKIVPYAAVIYDVEGGTWVYVKEQSDALSFVRAPISIDYIEGDLAFLTEGPAVGTEVVTVGGAELYGAETGVSK